ncbi:MAG: MFS transporter [Bacillota bacterium]|nr:MFS transporter [Bacillota bacterium]
MKGTRPTPGANPLAALSHRNFRLFWSGQCVSLIGTWIQRASQAWLVLEMTGSPFLLGLVGAAQFVPVLILSLFAGVVADRVSKRKLVMYMQVALGVQAFILSALVYTGKVQYWHVLVLAMLQGICTAFDNPTRQSFIVEMVGKEHLMNAIALNSAIFNGARIIGPALGGFAMDAFGPALAFFLNGVSYLFVVGALFFVKVQELPSKNNERRFTQEIMEGLRYVKDTPAVRETLSLVGVIGMFALNLSILVPVLARDVLQQSASGYGLLMSFMGAGALLGAATLAWFSHHGPKRQLLYGGAIALTVMQLALALPHAYWSAGVLLFLLGWAQITYSATANSSLQVNAPNHLRGRVMSIYSLLNGGVTPVGNLFAGTAMSLYGASGGFLACGGVGLIGALALWYGTKHSATKKP